MSKCRCDPKKNETITIASVNVKVCEGTTSDALEGTADKGAQLRLKLGTGRGIAEAHII